MLTIALSQIVASTRNVQLCTSDEGEYRCLHPNHSLVKKLNLPNTACIFHDCSECVSATVSYVVTDNYDLLEATSFMQRPTGKNGKQKFISCRERNEPCDCDSKCSGTSEVCSIMECNSNSPCRCQISNTTYELLHIHNDRVDINPAIVSFRNCLYRKPRVASAIHSRRLLEYEEATFSASNLTISFRDPIITVSENGRLIIRAPNYEHIFHIKDELQVVLPVEFLAYKQMITCIFISETGKAVYGQISIQGKTVCRTTECLLCKEFLLQTLCWPKHLAYPFYAFLIVIVAIILKFVKNVIYGIFSVIKAIIMALLLIGHLCRGLARLFLLCGEISGTKFRDSFEAMVQFLENNAPGRIPRNNGMLVLLALCAVISSGNADCSTHSLIASELKHCKTQISEQTCEMSTTAQVTLMGIDHEVCLWFQDKTGANLYHLKIRLASAQCEFNTQRRYFTFPVTTKSVSTLACPQNSQCGWGTHCVAGKEFEGITDEARNFPGYNNCLPSSVGSGCAIVSRMGCLFHRVYFVPELLASYEVRAIQGHTCTYTLAVEETQNATVQFITLSHSAVTHGGIRIEMVGAFDQPQVYLPESLVVRVGDPREAYLVEAAPMNHPVAGAIGQVQANSSYTKDFSFDPAIAVCDYFETTLRCHTKTDFLKTTTTSKENALPIARGLHLLSMDNTKLTSRLLSTAPVQVLLNIKNFHIIVQTKDVCPKIDSEEVTTKGCYSCGILATMEFTAHSTCSYGLVSVEFQTILLYTKSISLTTEAQSFVIQFHAEQKCYEEKLCLSSKNMRTCKLLQFCLQEPSLNLLRLNTSYTRNFLKVESTGSFFDMFSMPTLTGIFYIAKFIGTTLLIICLGITIISTCITCCRR